MTAVLDSLGRALSAAGLVAEENAPFGELTTYGVGGRCALMVRASGQAELLAVARVVADSAPVPVYVLGNGSNTLVADSGFDGLVIRVLPLRDTSEGVDVGDVAVTADGCVPLPVLARRSVAAGACGLEWAVGVPGTVGGAVRMNAGGHGAETIDSLMDVRLVSLVTGATADFPARELGLHFRGSGLRDSHIVLAARFAVHPPDGHDCAAELSEIVAWRRANQPGGRNAGSVFVNPAPGAGSSGALIDAAGLRGFACGGASVSDKHANFIQVSAGASAADVVAVMDAVQERVARGHGVTLRSEVRMVGFDGDVTTRFAGTSHADDATVRASASIAARLGETK